MNESEDKASKLKGLAWLVGGVLLASAFAFGIAPFVQLIPWEWERGLSQHIPSAEETCRGSTEANAALTKLVKRIYPVMLKDEKISIQVAVIHDSGVNAYAGLGGNIFVYAGLLKKATSADEVAGILAHEIEHIKRRHILENVFVRFLTIGGLQIIFTGASSADAQWIKYFLDMNFSRRQEAQADIGGLERLQEAHVSNQGFKNFFRRMEENEALAFFFSDHPGHRERFALAEKYENKNVTPALSNEEWLKLKNFCGNELKTKREAY
jgi:predicted Zn-dependent protease